MNLLEAEAALKQRLTALYDEAEAASIADWVMESLTGKSKVQRRLDGAGTLAQEEAAVLENYTAELLAHRPVQYVLGESYFYGMKLFVDERVLIPRPETEELADWAVGDLKASVPSAVRVLDIGTGSGCLALAVAKAVRGARVTAVDISVDALDVARYNAAREQVPLELLQADILSGQAGTLPVFDVIISNPPYITRPEQQSILPHVLDYEPHSALFVTDGDPLQFYKAIEQFAREHLAPGGTVYLELHRDFAQETLRYYEGCGWTAILRKDMQGADRMLRCRRPSG